MKTYYSDQFVLPLPETHRFPMSKYALLRSAVLDQEIISVDDLIVPQAASDEEILRVHCPEYLRRVCLGELDAKEVRALGFPWSTELVERSRRSVGGTTGAARAALEEGVSVNLAGGTHHAFSGSGHGFCVLNDIAVAARTLLDIGTVARVLVVDCDVHQGDGTAKIFENETAVFTLSLHGQKNFPFRKQKSDLDIGFEDGTGDEEYLRQLRAALGAALDRGPFDLAFFQAGADPYELDTLGRLALSKAGLAARDRLVFDTCFDARLPLATVMGGGYALDVADTVAIHLKTVEVAHRTWQRWQRLRPP